MTNMTTSPRETEWQACSSYSLIYKLSIVKVRVVFNIDYCISKVKGFMNFELVYCH